MTFDKMCYNEIYDKNSNGYILNFSYCPILNNVFRFSNIHSMFVNSIVEFNTGLVFYKYQTFMKKFLSIFNNLTIYQQTYLFKHFTCEKDWDNEQLIKLINFIKQKGENYDIF